MNANELVDVIDKIYFITEEDRKKYPILKDLSMVYHPNAKKMDLESAKSFAENCNALDCNDWRLPHLMGKNNRDISTDEKDFYNDKEKMFTEKREFIENVSEMAAIIDIFRSRSEDDNYFLCLGTCWFYLTDNLCDCSYFKSKRVWTVAGDCFGSHGDVTEWYDFVLVR